MAQNNNGGSDDGLLLFLFGGVVIILALYFGLPFLKEYFLTLKLWQMEIIARIIPTNYHVELLNNLRLKPSYDWTFSEMAAVGYRINYYFLPLILMLFFSTISFVKKKLYTAKKYNKTYSVLSLLQQESKVWRYLIPIVHENILEQDPTKGAWASGKKPQEIALEMQLLNNKNDLESLNEEKASQYFANQLGDLFIDMDSLSIANKELVGCFAAQLMEENAKALKAFGDISESFGKGKKADFSSGLELFEKYKDNKKVLDIMSGHAYVYTAMARLFDESGSKGIIITKYFIWLKPYDRRLYYMLNKVGRKVSWTECGGIVDHYQYECALGKPMVKLYVQNAVVALKEKKKKVKLTEKLLERTGQK